MLARQLLLVDWCLKWKEILSTCPSKKKIFVYNLHAVCIFTFACFIYYAFNIIATPLSIYFEIYTDTCTEILSWIV